MATTTEDLRRVPEREQQKPEDPLDPEMASLVDDDGDGDGTAPEPEVPHRGDEERRRTRRYWLLLLLPLLVGGLVRGLVGSTDDVPTNDATAYLRSGYSILDDQGFRR
ncbi:hypothetical protein B7486_73220, partial [cyanobacterium TDX16]